MAINTVVGDEVESCAFVHKYFEDQGVRFRLLTRFEQSKALATIVEYRIATPALSVRAHEEVFGTNAHEFDKATAVFGAWVMKYMTTGALP